MRRGALFVPLIMASAGLAQTVDQSPVYSVSTAPVSGSACKPTDYKSLKLTRTNPAQNWACIGGVWTNVTPSGSGGTGTPGGSPTQVQYQINGSTFGGDPDFTWDATLNKLVINGLINLATLQAKNSGGLKADFNADGTNENDLSYDGTAVSWKLKGTKLRLWPSDPYQYNQNYLEFSTDSTQGPGITCHADPAFTSSGVNNTNLCNIGSATDTFHNAFFRFVKAGGANKPGNVETYLGDNSQTRSVDDVLLAGGAILSRRTQIVGSTTQGVACQRLTDGTNEGFSFNCDTNNELFYSSTNQRFSFDPNDDGAPDQTIQAASVGGTWNFDNLTAVTFQNGFTVPVGIKPTFTGGWQITTGGLGQFNTATGQFTLSTSGSVLLLQRSTTGASVFQIGSATATLPTLVYGDFYAQTSLAMQNTAPPGSEANIGKLYIATPSGSSTKDLYYLNDAGNQVNITLGPNAVADQINPGRTTKPAFSCNGTSCLTDSNQDGTVDVTMSPPSTVDLGEVIGADGLKLNPDGDSDGTGDLTLQGPRLITTSRERIEDLNADGTWETVLCGDRDRDGTFEFVDDLVPCVCVAQGLSTTCTGSPRSRDLTGDGTADGAGVRIVIDGVFSRPFWSRLDIKANWVVLEGRGWNSSGVYTLGSGKCGGGTHANGFLDDANSISEIGAAFVINGDNVTVRDFFFDGGSPRSTYTRDGTCNMDQAAGGVGNQCSPTWCPQDSEQFLSILPNRSNVQISRLKVQRVDRAGITVDGQSNNSKVAITDSRFTQVGEHSIWLESPNFTISRNYFEECGERSKACIVQGGGAGGAQQQQIVSHNEFFNCSGVCIGNEYSTASGQITRGVSIVGNTFRWPSGASSGMAAAYITSTSSTDQVVQGISFSANTIDAPNSQSTSSFVQFRSDNATSLMDSISIVGNTISAKATTSGRGQSGIVCYRCTNSVVDDNTIEFSSDSTSDQASTSNEFGISFILGSNNSASGNTIRCTNDGCGGYQVNGDTNLSISGGNVNIGDTASSVDQRFGVYAINAVGLTIDGLRIRGPSSAGATAGIAGVYLEGSGGGHSISDVMCEKTSQCVWFNCSGTACANSKVTDCFASGFPTGNLGVHFTDSGTAGTNYWSQNVSLAGFVDAANEASTSQSAQDKGFKVACDQDGNGVYDANCSEIAGSHTLRCSEGATNDANEGCDDLVDPTADRTWTKPNASGRYVIANSAANTEGAVLWTSTTSTCTTICSNVSLTCRDAYPAAGGASVGCANTAANRTCWCSAL